MLLDALYKLAFSKNTTTLTLSKYKRGFSAYAAFLSAFKSLKAGSSVLLKEVL